MITKFKFNQTNFNGSFTINPFSNSDERGVFIKDYNIDTFIESGINLTIKEIFYTKSKKGVIRALHTQLNKPQAKLIRCISGEIFDVIVDIRPNSKTFGHWQSFILTGSNQISLYIPGGFAHGYLVIEDAIVSYKCNEVFDSAGDTGITYNDPTLNIKWPFELIGGKDNLIISEKDINLPTFLQFVGKYEEK
jgi:dTDP-4-dehydrorhamnose 3,5-epimerase